MRRAAVGSILMVEVRAPRVNDAAGVGRAWEDGRELYSEVDPRAFLPPDPADTGLGQALLGGLLEACERSDTSFEAICAG